MKNQNRGWSVLITLALFLLSCDNDPIEQEGGAGKITVQFETGLREFIESSGEQVINLKLSSPSPADGVLTIKPGSGALQNVTTVPAAEGGLIRIALVKGETNVPLKLIPIDNTVKEGERIFEFIIHELTTPFTSGTTNVLKVKVKDDETTSPVVESLANFISQSITLKETNQEGVEYQVHFSEAVAMDSEIKINVSSEQGTYGVVFSTEPAAESGVVSLTVAQGARVIGFRIRPVNNNRITGELKINLAISETAGSIRKGQTLQQVLTIADDELVGKPRGYEVSATNTTLKKFYEYDEQGRISKVEWEYFTSYRTAGTDIYHYDQNGSIIRIDKNGWKQILYRWENGRIVRSDEQVNGVIQHYAEYAYDDHGNVGGVVSYHRQADGTYVKGLYTIYLYFLDGNLHKSLTYQDNQDPEAEPHLISTKTYDNYIEASNPFPMTEILPTMKAQTKLATTYRVEESGQDLTYNMTYEFLDDGLPAKRIASAPGDMQTAVYHYY